MSFCQLSNYVIRFRLTKHTELMITISFISSVYPYNVHSFCTYTNNVHIQESDRHKLSHSRATQLLRKCLLGWWPLPWPMFVICFPEVSFVPVLSTVVQDLPEVFEEFCKWNILGWINKIISRTKSIMRISELQWS